MISKRQILVVDDEPYICSAYKLMFRHEGHMVHIASNATEALGLLELHQFDLVILDFAMPGMKGDELAGVIRQRRPQLPIIMVTAHADALKSSRHPLPGVDCLLAKPCEVETLRESIAKLFPKAETG